MRKLILAAASAVSAVLFALGLSLASPIAASAAPDHPAFTGFVWENVASSNTWRNNSSDVFVASSTLNSQLAAGTSCNGAGFCEHLLSGGDCITDGNAYGIINDELVPGAVIAEACDGDAAQLWQLNNNGTVGGNTVYTWVSYYGNNHPGDYGCNGSNVPVIRDDGTSGDPLGTRCAAAGSGTTAEQFFISS